MPSYTYTQSGQHAYQQPNNSPGQSAPPAADLCTVIDRRLNLLLDVLAVLKIAIEDVDDELFDIKERIAQMQWKTFLTNPSHRAEVLNSLSEGIVQDDTITSSPETLDCETFSSSDLEKTNMHLRALTRRKTKLVAQMETTRQIADAAVEHRRSVKHNYVHGLERASQRPDELMRDDGDDDELVYITASRQHSFEMMLEG